MVGILDEAYPARLREIHQAPPFLFAAGELMTEDPAIAVVGSRKASERGLSIATSIATALADEHVTVLSGLAAEIDAAAHTAALAGWRTYRRHHRYRHQQAVPGREPGASRSDRREGSRLQPAYTGRHNFLMRNAVMSGYGYATVVVEAGEQSGARAQARMAVEHGRPVILTDQVVATNEWAKALIERPSVYVASGMEEAMNHIRRVLNRDNKVDELLGELLGAGL